jgi:hypothetical protein
MTLPRWYAIQRLWCRHPPVHILAAAWLGVGAARREPAGDMADLIRFLGVDPARPGPGVLR